MSSRLASILLAPLLAALALAPRGEARGSSNPAPSGGFSPAGHVFMTRDEALALAFPECKVKRTTRYLTEVDRAAVAKLAKVEFESGVVYPYVARKDGKVVGTAYFDTHRVRTMRETLMLVVAPDGSVRRIEVLSFAEPRDYIPRDSWYAQFRGRKLDEDLSLKRKIKPVTGATLTAKATTSCARRLLALHQTLERLAKSKAEKAKKKAADAKKKRGEVPEKGGAGAR